MAIRLEKSGGLFLIRGGPDPAPAKRNNFEELGLWLALMVLVAGVLFVPAHAMSWGAVSHTVKALFVAVR